jgi:hypothetical protein
MVLGKNEFDQFFDHFQKLDEPEQKAFVATWSEPLFRAFVHHYIEAPASSQDEFENDDLDS